MRSMSKLSFFKRIVVNFQAINVLAFGFRTIACSKSSSFTRIQLAAKLGVTR
jgi:hypothetical protein